MTSGRTTPHRIQLLAATLALALAVSSPTQAELFQVDRTDDPATGGSFCSRFDVNDCSLRGAILLSNAGGGNDKILVPAGTYVLTLQGDAEDSGFTGDLDLTQKAWIVGDGWLPTLVSASGLGDRLVDVHQGASGSTIEGLSLAYGDAGAGVGFAGRGGGLLVREDVSIQLREVLLAANSALEGGGLYVDGASGVAASELQLINNDAAGRGGGAYVYGVLNADRSQVSGNTAGAQGGGLYLEGLGHIELTSSLLADNVALAGGGLAAVQDEVLGAVSVKLMDSTVARNAALAGAGLRLQGVGSVVLWHATLAAQEGGDLRALLAVGTASFSPHIQILNSIFAAPCELVPPFVEVESLGGNMEMSSATCGLDHRTDQVGVSPQELGLLPLADYGGSTPTVALGENSVARGAAVAAWCTAHDQRQAPRDPGDCDSGAFEYVPGFLFADDFESEDLWAWSASAP